MPSTQPAAPAQDPQIAEQERITALLIGQAQAEIGAAAANAAGSDSKALALLALDVALAAVLVANRTSLDRLWWASTVGLGLSAAFFLLTVVPRRFPVGPELRQFYRRVIGGRALDANVALLDALTQIIDLTKTRAQAKSLRWSIGLSFLVLTAVGTGIVQAMVR